MKQKCKCIYCGETFNFGDEGDNEKMHLRCERESILENQQDIDYDEYDRSAYESERIEIMRHES